MMMRTERESDMKWDRGRREAAGDGATSHPVKAFQFGDIGNAYERKPSR